MPKLVICRGLPGSGKTTLAKNLVESLHYARVNRDDIRIEQLGIHTGIGTYKQEELVTEIQQTLVRKYLRFDVNVVVDDTNLRAAVSRSWAVLAQECGAEFQVVDMNTPLQTCKERVLRRAADGGRFVPLEVIEDMHAKFLAKGPLPAVVLPEKAEILQKKYQHDGKKVQAWIFDIDGTLAKISPNRSPYDWQKVHLDTVHEPVRGLLADMWRHGYAIILVSGRDSGCRDVTEKWLEDNKIAYDALLMRVEGDCRKDTIVKAELFWEHVAPFYDVEGVVDDRNSVVQMWRDLGLKCYQCELGDF